MQVLRNYIGEEQGKKRRRCGASARLFNAVILQYKSEELYELIVNSFLKEIPS